VIGFEESLVEVLRADHIIAQVPGTFGLVYVLANPKNTIPQRIAVKAIHPSVLKKKSLTEAIRIFDREIVHWQRYGKHPLILKPFRVVWIHDRPFVVMPYCEASLRDVIDSDQYSLSVRLAIAVQICHALLYATEKGLVAHQDLKPENVLLSDLHKKFSPQHPLRWQVRVSDFGLANAMQELERPYGSRPYMAPEQYQNVSVFSGVDVFALGAMFVELLTGLHPVGERTSDVWPEPKAGKGSKYKRKKFWKSWAEEQDKRIQWANNVPDEIKSLCFTMLYPDSQQRPSLLEVESALKGALAVHDKRMLLQLEGVIDFLDNLEKGILPSN